MAQPYVFREYTSDDSFTNLVDIPAAVTEIQVALTFARDYDGNHSTNGRFIPYWDAARVTPAVIANFKEQYPSAKVLVSIGNDNGQFPFHIDEPGVGAWIAAATESLTGIIQEYNLDGIDVFYEDIDVSNPAIFVECVGQLITALKNKNVITRASISPNFATSGQFYKPLYEDFAHYIDNIDFQCFVGPFSPAPLHDYPSEKLLLGYTGIREDWPSAKIPPSLFIVLCYILLNGGSINGASIKVTRCSITYFPPKVYP